MSGIYEYGVGINIALIIAATFVLTCGVSFFIRAKNAGSTKVYVLMYGLTAGLWCMCYGLIGFCQNPETAMRIRQIGLWGVNGLLVVDYYAASDFSRINRTLRRYIGLAGIVYSVIDILIFGSREVDEFFQMGNWMTWMGNECWQRSFHQTYVMVTFLVLLATAIIWVLREKVKRRKVFMWLLIVGNFFMIFSSVPDTFFDKAHIPALPTSGFGAAICAIIIWYGAVRLNAFQISIVNAVDSIYNRINVGIIVYDMQRKLVLANPYACTHLGINETDSVGREMKELFAKSEKQTDDMIDACFENAMRYGESEIMLQSGNGRGDFSVKTTVARDSYGEPYCYISAIYDMSETLQMMEELRVASQAKSDFLASMSHEIRTPINAVLGLDEMILRESSEKEIKGYAADIQSAGRSLLSIINDILDFSKIESGKMDIIPVNYHLSSLINDCYNMIAMRAQEKSLKLVVENDEGLPVGLCGDEIRIRQIIVNLLTNAVKYTKEGTVTITVGMCSEKRTSVVEGTAAGDEEVLTAEEHAIEKGDVIRLMIKVMDTGMGIRPESLPVLFDSFQRIEEAKNRSIEGTGLGLAITKQLTEQMGGEICVESEYGKGSCFTVFLPQLVTDETAIGNIYEQYISTTTEHKEYHVSFTAPDAHILVVDDVKMNLIVFKGLLKQTQMQIDTATSGEQALEKIRENAYDMIFMDHMMPGMDGIETLNHIREDKQHPNQTTPVIALTANALSGASEEYMAAGFAGYLSKPVESRRLEKMILKFVERGF